MPSLLAKNKIFFVMCFKHPTSYTSRKIFDLQLHRRILVLCTCLRKTLYLLVLTVIGTEKKIDVEEKKDHVEAKKYWTERFVAMIN